LSDHATICSNCGSAVGGANATAGATAERVKTASKDAMGAFLGLLGNPVGGLAPAARSLGSSRTLGVGIVFGLVFAVLFTMALHKGMGMLLGFGFGGDALFRIFITALVPFVALAAAGFGVRSVSGGNGGLGEDAFLAGAALLPFGAVTALAALLGMANLEVIMILNVFALCFTVLMIYAGLTEIYGLSVRAASLWVPGMFLVSFWLTKVIATAITPGPDLGGFEGLQGF
jgi:hypothetical protein